MFCSFLNAAISNGIYFAPSKFEAGFISYKHGDKEIDKTLEIVEEIIKNGDIKNEI
jgi:glutamate-1-semialdehyde 2,1-aminomutase